VLLTCAVTTNSRQHNIATPNRRGRVITPLSNLIEPHNGLQRADHESGAL